MVVRGRLEERGLDVRVPDEAGRGEVQRLMMEEVAAGVIKPETRAVFKRLVEGLVSEGADCLILGSTEWVQWPMTFLLVVNAWGLSIIYLDALWHMMEVQSKSRMPFVFMKRTMGSFGNILIIGLEGSRSLRDLDD